MRDPSSDEGLGSWEWCSWRPPGRWSPKPDHDQSQDPHHPQPHLLDALQPIVAPSNDTAGEETDVHDTHIPLCNSPGTIVSLDRVWRQIHWQEDCPHENQANGQQGKRMRHRDLNLGHKFSKHCVDYAEVQEP